MKVTDEKIKEYCGRMNYKLLDIGKIAFAYEKPNGEQCALLKAAAHSLDHRPLNKVVEDGQVEVEVCEHCGSTGRGYQCKHCRNIQPAT